MKPLISAIIPVYNSEEFLEECVQSLINQTLKEIEIIFINDGSIDRSLEILKKYEVLDNRIIVINQENEGPSAARNKGIEIAKGEYISFIDSDDWIHKDMYKKMHSRAVAGDLDLVICDMKIIEQDRETYLKGLEVDIQKLSYDEIKDNILNELLGNSGFNSMANKIFRTSIIKNNNLRLNINIYYAEDWLFNIEFFKYVKKVFYINEAYYFYRRGHESSSSNYDNNTFERVGLWLYRKRKEYAKEYRKDEALAANDLFKVIIHCSISEYRRSDIDFKKKSKRVKEIISCKDTREVISNINKHKLPLKEKMIFKLIKNKANIAIYIYTIIGIAKRKLVHS